MSLEKCLPTCDICAVVVIYNVQCGDSPTCQALSKIHDPSLQVLIYDNSTVDLGNREFCAKKGWVYLGGLGNAGLSKAYNASIAYLKQKQQVKLVCLFDDDTQIAAEYFNLLREAGKHTTNRIFVPLIYSNHRLLSPCILKRNHRTKLFKSEQEAICYGGEDLSAINSCMALDLSLFENYQYDENIFLDGIDHNFLMQMKQKGECITVFPFVCNHEFSGDSMPSKKAALVRFSIYATDYRYIMRNNLLGYMMLLGRRTLHLTVQYRSLCFIKVFFAKLF